MTIQERLARAKAGDVVKPTSVLSSSAPKNNLSVTERLNIAKQASVPVVPKQAEPGTLERVGLAVKSGVGSGVSGSLGALQTAGQWLGSKASDLFGTEKALQDPEKLALLEKMAQSGAFGQQPKGEAVLNPDKLHQQSGQDLARATEGTSGVGKFALEGLSSVANMGTGALTSLATGMPFIAAMGVQAGGDAALSAKEQGKTIDQQLLYGGATGLTVGAIEALGGIGASKALAPAKAKVATALLSKLPEGVLKWASSTGAKAFGRILGSGFSEALEEGIEYNTDRWLQKLVLDEEVPFDIKEMAYQSLLGGTVGGLFGAADVGTKAVRNRIGNAKQTQTIGTETQTAPNVPATPPQSTQADSIAQTDIPMPQEQLSQQRATESVIEDTNIPDARIGRAGEAYTAHNEPVRFRYAIVSADSLVTSHDRYGYTNKAYPVEMQPRDRTRASSMLQVNKMSKELNPRRLAESAEAQNGAPIVRNDGVVIGGNGRVLAVKAAYEDGFGANYETFLRENAAKYGIEGDLPPNPVLIRISDNVDSFEKLAQTLNETATATYSATEYSMADANKMANILDLFIPNDDGRINTSDNTDFIRAFVNQVIPETERGGAITKTGKLSQTGLNRARNAIFAAAYGDPELSARLSEYTDDNTKNLTNALLNTAPNALHIKTGIESGSLYNINIIEDVIQAARLYEYTKSTGSSISENINQTSMLEQYSPETQAIAFFVEANKRSAKQIRLFLNSIYDAINELGDPNQISLLGGEADGATKQDIINAATLDYLQNTEVENPNIGFSLDEYNMAAESRAAGGETTASEGAGETVVATNGNEATAGEVEWQDSFLGTRSKPTVTQTEETAQPEAPKGEFIDDSPPKSVGAMKSKFPHEQKVSEFYTNTLSETDTISDEARARLDEKDFGFVSVSEAESVATSQQRLEVDFEGEVEHLSQADTYVAAEDVDTAMGILASYSAEASETGDWSKIKDWAQNMYEKVHQSAVTLQALDKYSRTPEGAVITAQQEISKRERKLTTTEVNGRKVKNKLGREIADDTETVKTIVDEISKGKTLEDVKEKSKRLKKVKLQDIVDLVASGKYTDEAITDMVKAKYGVPTLTAEDVRNIYEYAQLEQETTDDYQKRVYKYKQNEIIANRMTSTFGEKVLMTRRLAMLLNPKTVISRNAGGNVVFGTAEIIKDAPGTAIDYLVSQKTGKRTTSLNLYETAKAQGKGAKKAVTEIAKDVKLGVDTSPTRHELPTAKTFESKLGRGAEDVLNVLMQFGDRPFFEGTYEARMKELQRLGYDVKSEDVKAHATSYALERVFQNDSELSKKASSIRKSLGLLGDITMPFVQTPTNIFDKLLDYSPYGYVRAIKQAGSISNSPWSQKQFVDTLARSMTGTGVLLLGYFGFLKGFLTGSKRDENEKVVGAEQRAGVQEYSVVVDGKSYTYDWASPVGALLAMGANMAQASVNKDSIVSMLATTTKAGIDVMFEQSYLQGLSELFGKENFSEGLQGIMMGLPASFIPTGFQQIARLIDNTQRDTFDKDPVMRMLKRMAVKTPFASKMLPPKIDPTGEEAKQFQGRSTASNAFESFISPGYIGENVQNAVDKELYDLYSRTGDTDALPKWSLYTSKADLKFSVGGQAYEMTDKEWTQYQKTLGKATYSEVDKLTKSPDYRKASDADKSEMIRDIISEATEKAKREIVEARGDMFLNKAGRERVQEYNKAGLNDKQAYELYNKIQALEPKDGKKTVSQSQKLDVISSSGHSAKVKAGLVATLYDNSLLPKLDSHNSLLSAHKSTGDTTYINMTVPDKFSENKTEYILTEREQSLYERTFVDFMNKQGKPAPIGSLKAEQNRLKKLIGFAKDRARMEVIKSRRK